jgi:hypothetical protein
MAQQGFWRYNSPSQIYRNFGDQWNQWFGGQPAQPAVGMAPAIANRYRSGRQATDPGYQEMYTDPITGEIHSGRAPIEDVQNQIGRTLGRGPGQGRPHPQDLPVGPIGTPYTPSPSDADSAPFGDLGYETGPINWPVDAPWDEFYDDTAEGAAKETPEEIMRRRYKRLQDQRKAAANARQPEGGIPIGQARYYGATPMQNALFNFGTNFLTSGFQNALPSAVRDLNTAFGQQAAMAWQAEQQNKRLNEQYAANQMALQGVDRQSQAQENVARIKAEVERQALENQLAQINQNFDIRNRALGTLGGIFGQPMASPMPGGAGGYNPFGGVAATPTAAAPGAAALPYYNFQTQPPTPQQIQQAQVGMSNFQAPGMRGDIARNMGASQANQFMRGATQTASQLGSQRQGAEVADIIARNQARQRNMQNQWTRQLNQAKLAQAALA